jgi:hypothetical protein
MMVVPGAPETVTALRRQGPLRVTWAFSLIRPMVYILKGNCLFVMPDGYYMGCILGCCPAGLQAVTLSATDSGHWSFLVGRSPAGGPSGPGGFRACRYLMINAEDFDWQSSAYIFHWLQACHRAANLPLNASVLTRVCFVPWPATGSQAKTVTARYRLS